MTAQIAAGIQPISVICNIKQSIAVKILPLKKKETNGKKMAIKVMVCFYCYCFLVFFFLGTSGTLALTGYKKLTYLVCPKSFLAQSEAHISPAAIIITSFNTSLPAPDK